jgi:hypothetical protein
MRGCRTQGCRTQGCRTQSCRNLKGARNKGAGHKAAGTSRVQDTRVRNLKGTGTHSCRNLNGAGTHSCRYTKGAGHTAAGTSRLLKHKAAVNSRLLNTRVQEHNEHCQCQAGSQDPASRHPYNHCMSLLFNFGSQLASCIVQYRRAKRCATCNQTQCTAKPEHVHNVQPSQHQPCHEGRKKH